MLPFQMKTEARAIFLGFPFPFSVYIYTENGTNRKHQDPFVCCKWKTERADFRLFPANGNKFVFLDRQTINGNQRLLFQQTAHLCLIGWGVMWLFYHVNIGGFLLGYRQC